MVAEDESPKRVAKAPRSLAYRSSEFRALNESVRLLVSQFQAPESRELVAFVCECRRPHCFATVEITLAEFEAVRSDDAYRLICPGHEDEAEETVISTNRYALVRPARD